MDSKGPGSMKFALYFSSKKLRKSMKIPNVQLTLISMDQRLATVVPSLHAQFRNIIHKFVTTAMELITHLQGP